MKIVPGDLSKRDAHELVMSAIVPRPIAFVSTVGEDGVFNLAPYSCFAPMVMKPAIICLGIGRKRDGQKKDTLRNIEFSNDFVVNIVEESMAEAMNKTAPEYPSHVDEFQEVGFTALKSDLVKAPRLVESPVNMECKVREILEFGEFPTSGHVVIAEVVLFHIKDELWAGNQIDMTKLKAIARLGGQFYCRKSDMFEMERPSTL